MFPLLEFNDELILSANYEAIPTINYRMPNDRYLTLHVTNKTETRDQDTLYFAFHAAVEESCRNLRQYFMTDETILEWNGGSSYVKVKNGEYQLRKTHLNTDLKAGTSMLLHVPRGCRLTLNRVSRRFNRNYLDVPDPSTISLSDEIPPVCRNLPFYWLALSG